MQCASNLDHLFSFTTPTVKGQKQDAIWLIHHKRYGAHFPVVFNICGYIASSLFKQATSFTVNQDSVEELANMLLNEVHLSII